MSDPQKASGEQESFPAGVLLIDKPAGATSFSIVRTVRRLVGIKKVGHAGTLDPFATGLLIVCVGRPATRLIERFMDGRKVYRAELQLGQETDTLDPEGRVTKTMPVPELDEPRIRECLSSYVGRRKQVPPQYSAVKYKGKPLYHYARKGIEVTKEPREIEIFSLALKDYDSGSHRLEIEVVCSRGTYVRVLAADLGNRLGCCASLTALRRLGSGKFSVDEAISGPQLAEAEAGQLLEENMIPVARILELLDALE